MIINLNYYITSIQYYKIINYVTIRKELNINNY